MAQLLSLRAPKGWHELTQPQLRFLLATIARVNRANINVKFRSQEDFKHNVMAQVNTICLFRWNNIELIQPTENGWLVRHDSRELPLLAEQIAAAAQFLNWTREIPSEPVRLETVDGAHAVEADLPTGFSFDDWLACEALWQQYQITQSYESLAAMAEILYRKEKIRLNEAESLGIFYWWASVKKMMAELFPNFFKVVDPNSVDGQPSYDDLRRNVDAQIRALTKGDVTKEAEILALNAIRAITELDAQAREYDEIRKKYPSQS